MNNGVVANLVKSALEDRPAQGAPFDQGPVVRNLELTIERAVQGGRTCRLCAAVSGRFDCQPSAGGREWRSTEGGTDLIVSLTQREPGLSPRLQAYVLIENEGYAHARAIYCSEPLNSGLLEGPWILKLISEESECDFVFPVHVDVVSSDKLSVPAGVSG